eukprot:gene9400-10383_t
MKPALFEREQSFAGSVASTVNSFNEKDFQLPDLEVFAATDFESVQQEKRSKFRRKSIQYELIQEQKVLSQLDEIVKMPEERFSRRPGVLGRPLELKVAKGDHEARAELDLLNHVLKRKPGDLRDEMELIEQIISGCYDGDDVDEHLGPPSLDHPKLGSVQEKQEDLRQEAIENWCVRHGMKISQKYTNKEKRFLRKWFQALDYDGSGEVNVEELQDPMLSSGILKTREQVVRVLANVDRNNTMGIDFEEFLLALNSNKLADQAKLKKLQQMSADPFFNVDTLIAIERRKKLMKSILKRCEERQNEIDKLYKKYDKPKLTKKEKELFNIEREALEEEHNKSIYLHLKYVTALDGVIEEKKRFYQEQAKQKELNFEERINQLSSQEIYRTVSQIRFGTSGIGGGEVSSSSNRPVSRQEMMNKIEVAVATHGLQPIRSRGSAISLALQGSGGGVGGSPAKIPLPMPVSSLRAPRSESTNSRSTLCSVTVSPLRTAMKNSQPNTKKDNEDVISPTRHRRAAPLIIRSHNDLADNRFKIYAPVTS